MAGNTFELECEYTDTFGGVANYSWVRRATLTIHKDGSKRLIHQRIKQELSISGLNGRWYDHGDVYEFRPYHMCTVAYATVKY